jgi:ABC-type branched-subunit amino acid transport system ATPase component
VRGDPRIALLVLGLVVLVVVSFGLGRYVLTPWTVVQVFLGQVITIPVHWTSTDQTVILQIRLPRGAGKTTLLRCLLGLLTPERGTIRVAGKDIAAPAPVRAPPVPAYR